MYFRFYSQWYVSTMLLQRCKVQMGSMTLNEQFKGYHYCYDETIETRVIILYAFRVPFGNCAKEVDAAMIREHSATTNTKKSMEKYEARNNDDVQIRFSEAIFVY